MNCPECGGVRVPNHPAGPLVVSHEPTCSLGAAEDARKVADVDALGCVGDVPLVRATTVAESVLMAAATGVDVVDVPAEVTVVSVVGAALIRRQWDGLDPDQPQEETT